MNVDWFVKPENEEKLERWIRFWIFWFKKKEFYWGGWPKFEVIHFNLIQMIKFKETLSPHVILICVLISWQYGPGIDGYVFCSISILFAFQSTYSLWTKGWRNQLSMLLKPMYTSQGAQSLNLFSTLRIMLSCFFHSPIEEYRILEPKGRKPKPRKV